MKEYTKLLDLSPEEMADENNLAEYLSDEHLLSIGNKVVRGYEEDETSRADWVKKYNKGFELALQIHKEKTYPWAKASNIKFPLMTVAAMAFHARAYPALIPTGNIITAKVVGRDIQGLKARRAKRVEAYQNYQLREEMVGWEEDMDRFLLTLPITGTEFKKIYYDGEAEQNVSEHVFAKDLVVHYYAKSLEKAARKTHIIQMSSNDVMEKINAGLYLDIDLSSPTPREDVTTRISDKTQGLRPPSVDDDTPYTILEQHGFYDLDGDGYKEPYIFTVVRDTKQVVRIVARYNKKSIKKRKGKVYKISPEEYFEVFKFLPSPDGGFYGLGFMHLIGPINESVNTIINQLTDAGTLSNLQSGFVSKIFRNKGGTFKFEPGEWKPVNAVSGQDLKQGLFPLPVREPSGVLFNLLGFLVEAGQRVTSTTDIMVGESPGQNQKATTTLTVMENGMKVFTAIYKRIRASLGREFKKLYSLNYEYFDPEKYLNVVEDLYAPEEEMYLEQDFNYKDCNIIPAADPEADSKIIQRQKAEVLMNMIPLGLPRGIVIRRFMEAMDIEHIEEFNLDALNNPPPDPEIMLKAQEQETEKNIEAAKLSLAEREQRRKETETGIKARQASDKKNTNDKKVSADIMLATAELAQKALEGAKGNGKDHKS